MSDRGRRKLSPAQRDEVVARWQGGELPGPLAREYGVHVSSLHVLARRRGGVPERNKSYVLSNERHDELVRRYLEGERDTVLAVEFGVSRSYAASAARRAGAPPRVARRYDHRGVDEGAFASVTPDSAYWIGMLMTDGCVLDPHLVRLGLAEQDAVHVEKFRAFLKSGHKISIHRRGPWGTRTRQPLHRLTVSNRQLCEDLARFGVVPRKTGKEIAPAELANNRDFWRGAVDGDGWVFIAAAKGEPRIGLCSASRPFVEAFRCYARSISPSEAGIQTNGDGVSALTLTGRHAKAVIRALYRGAVTALDRKAATAQRILQMP